MSTAQAGEGGPAGCRVAGCERVDSPTGRDNHAGRDQRISHVRHPCDGGGQRAPRAAVAADGQYRGTGRHLQDRFDRAPAESGDRAVGRRQQPAGPGHLLAGTGEQRQALGDPGRPGDRDRPPLHPGLAGQRGRAAHAVRAGGGGGGARPEPGPGGVRAGPAAHLYQRGGGRAGAGAGRWGADRAGAGRRSALAVPRRALRGRRACDRDRRGAGRRRVEPAACPGDRLVRGARRAGGARGGAGAGPARPRPRPGRGRVRLRRGRAGVRRVGA